MMFERGYTTLGKIWRIPVRVHFSLVFGLLYVSGFRFEPGAWLGYFVLVLAHELGHALLVRAYRLRVFAIEIHALGGACWHEPSPTRIAESVIAWGGVLAQLVLYVLASVILLLYPPDVAWLYPFWSVMLSVNLTIIAINLLPIAPLDGARAWQLPKLWLARRRADRRRRKPAAKERRGGKRKPAKDGEAPQLKLVRDKDGDFRFEADDDDKP
jgi:Zn-dependent protease